MRPPSTVPDPFAVATVAYTVNATGRRKVLPFNTEQGLAAFLSRHEQAGDITVLEITRRP